AGGSPNARPRPPRKIRSATSATAHGRRRSRPKVRRRGSIPCVDARILRERLTGVRRCVAVGTAKPRPFRLTGQKRRGFGLWGAMTPFVGRSDELALLHRYLSLAATPHGHVAAVLGEAAGVKCRSVH